MLGNGVSESQKGSAYGSGCRAVHLLHKCAIESHLRAATVTASDVLITGVGVCSAAGLGYTALAEGLQSGLDCSSPLETALPVQNAAQIKDVIEADADFPDDRKSWLALAAFKEAILDAGGLSSLNDYPERCGVFLGTGLSSVTAHEIETDLYPHLDRDGRFDRVSMAQDMRTDGPAPRRHMPTRLTDEIRRRAMAAGRSGTSFSACAASAQAIAEGAWAIRRGELDVAIVGGQDSMIHPMGLLSFVVLGALAEERCRPFDRCRSGFMIGEGAAILVLENAEHARKRGRSARAKFLGAGTSADAWNVTAPHPDGAGARMAMERALRDANVKPSAIDYVNAHGTGTPLGDRAEASAICSVFGPDTRVSSIKGSLGHCIAAAGAIEAAASIASIEYGFIPGTYGLQNIDAACPIRAQAEPSTVQTNLVLSNSFGFGGQNCSLVFGRADA